MIWCKPVPEQAQSGFGFARPLKYVEYYTDYIGQYRDNGKENGNYCLVLRV